jgi:hypothetical protein
MPPGKSPRRAGPRTLAALALAWALSPASAWGAASRPNEGVLSPRLTELAKPSVRSAPPAEQARDLSLPPQGAGSLLRRGNRVMVEVRFERGAGTAVDDLRATGAEVVDVSGRYQTVTVAAKPAELTALADVPSVDGVAEVLTPVLAAACPSGAVVSEGDAQLQATKAREELGVDGGGVTIGILSDSFAQAESAETSELEDIESGDLPGGGNPCGQPTPVDVLEDIEKPKEAADEGRAMAQIAHDLAPGANLAFASAFNGEISFAHNIERLAKPSPQGAGAQVIADDVFYPDEPFFQDGPVAVAADKVSGEGVAYFSAAGNENLIEEPKPGVRNDIASWEAPEFRDAGSCPAGVPSYARHCMDFNPGANVDTGFRFTVGPEATLTVDLQWAQPWEGVTTDLDAYLLQSGGRIGASEDANLKPSSQEPFEIVSWTNPSGAPANVTLAIDRCDTTCGASRAAANPKLTGTVGGDTGNPRLKFALLENGGGVASSEYPRSIGGDVVGPTIFGHNGTGGATSVGAVPAPLFFEGEPEPYSSRGPVTHYFGPVEPGTPAPELGSPEVLAKPDIAATDCGATTFFGFLFEEGPGEFSRRFCGTSAAAPHAAAVAALMLQKDPTATSQQVRLALEEGASPIPPFGPCAIGAGLVDAVGAIERLLTPGTGPAPGCAPPVSEPGEPTQDSAEVPPPAPAGTQTTNGPSPAPGPGEPPQSRRPQTFLKQHPPKVLRTAGRAATAVFRFGADESGVAFLCKFDRSPFRTCGSRTARRVGLGGHVLRVKARSDEGTTDPTPAVFRFRVLHVG